MNDEELDAWMATVSSGARCNTNDMQDEEEDIEGMVLEKLLKYKPVIDSPDIFKRVRFLSRWEDCPESRESRFCSIGDVHFWTMGTNGWAGLAQKQMRNAVRYHFSGSSGLRDIGPWSYNKLHPAHRIWVMVGFVGRTREESRPIVLLYSGLEELRRCALKTVKELAWLAPDSHILSASTSSSKFGTKVDWEERARRQNMYR
jgi:hypothetical protein